MVYVAFLRAVNLGTGSQVDMPMLKQLFIDNGASDVSTFLNSGNVVFRSNNSGPTLLAHAIQAALLGRFGRDIPVLIKSSTELVQIAKAAPADWANDDTQKCDVLLPWPELPSADLAAAAVYDHSFEQIIEAPGALIWRADRAHLRPGQSLKLSPKSLTEKITIRNINTIRKLAALANRPS